MKSGTLRLPLLCAALLGASVLHADPLPYPIDAYQNPNVVIPPTESNTWFWIGNPTNPTGNWGHLDSTPENSGNTGWWRNNSVSLQVPTGGTIAFGDTRSPYTQNPYSTTITLDQDRVANTLDIRSGTLTVDLNGKTFQAAVRFNSPEPVNLVLTGQGTFNFLGNGTFGGVLTGQNFSTLGDLPISIGPEVIYNPPSSNALVLGGTGNRFFRDQSETFLLNGVTLNQTDASAPSNNTVEVLDGGTLTVNGAIALNGSLFDNSDPDNILRTNNTLRIKDGSVLERGSNVTIGVGNRFEILNGSRVGSLGVGGSFTLENGAVFLMSGSSAFYAAGTANLNSGSTMTIDGSTLRFGNTNFNAGSASSITDSSFAIGAGSLAGSLSVASSVFDATSFTVQNGGSFSLNRTTASLGSFTVQPTGEVNVTGSNLTLSALTINGTFLSDASELLVNGKLTVTPTLPATGLTLDNGSTLSVIISAAGDSLLLSNSDLNIRNGSRLEINPAGASSSLNLSKAIVVDGENSEFEAPLSGWSVGSSTSGQFANDGRIVSRNGGKSRIGWFSISNGSNGGNYTLPVDGLLHLAQQPGIRPTNTNRNYVVHIPAGAHIVLGGGSAFPNVSNNGGELHLLSKVVDEQTVRSALGGSGTFTNDGPYATHLDGAVLDPGTSDAAGSLQFFRDVYVNQPSTVIFDILGFEDGAYDTVRMNSVSGAATLTVKVRMPDEILNDLRGGDLFKLFDQSNLGSVTLDYDLPALPGALQWDTSSVKVNGSLQVVDPDGPPTNDSVLWIGSSSTPPPSGDSAATVSGGTYIDPLDPADVVSVKIPIKKSGAADASYSVSVDGNVELISPAADTPVAWQEGAEVEVKITDTAVGTNTPAGHVIIKNLADDSSGLGKGRFDGDDTATITRTVYNQAVLEVYNDPVNFGNVLVNDAVQGEFQNSITANLTIARDQTVSDQPSFDANNTVTIDLPDGWGTLNISRINSSFQDRRIISYARTVQLTGHFNKSGVFDEFVNFDTPMMVDGQPVRWLDPASTLPLNGSIRPESFPVHIKAGVYDAPSFSTNPPAASGGFAPGETIMIKNAPAAAGGLRATGAISTGGVLISDGWSFGGFAAETAIAPGSSIDGTVSYNGSLSGGLTGQVRRGMLSILPKYLESDVLGAHSSSPTYIRPKPLPRLVIPLQTALPGQSAGLGEKRSGKFSDAAEFGRLSLTRDGGSDFSILDADSEKDVDFSIAFGAGDDASLSGDVAQVEARPDADPSKVFAYWNFNDLWLSNVEGVPGQNGNPVDLPAAKGNGNLSLAGVASAIAISPIAPQLGLINLQEGDLPGSSTAYRSSGGALTLQYLEGNGSYLEFAVDMAGKKDLQIAYAQALQANYTFGKRQWSWSADGVNFTDFGPAVEEAGKPVRLPVLTALDNVSTAYLRFTVDEAVEGYPRLSLDNITFSAKEISPPEAFMVVSMNYDPASIPAGQTPLLATRTAEGWVNVVLTNGSGTPVFVEGAYNPAAHAKGAYGRDSATHTVWAVVDAGFAGELAVQISNRVATLASLALDAGMLKPAFDAADIQLYAAVPNSTTAIKVTPSATASGATITVNGALVASGSESAEIPLGSADTAISIVVTAPDGTTSRIYTLTVSKVAGAIAAVTQAATDLVTGGVTLNGSVTSNGAGAAVVFEYGLDTNYGGTAKAAPSVVGGSSATAVSAALTGLQPGATYHFRVKASNSLDSAAGQDLTFVVPASGNNKLASLHMLSEGFDLDFSSRFAPQFSPDVTEYTAIFGTEGFYTQIFFVPVPEDPNATVTVNGQPFSLSDWTPRFSIGAGTSGPDFTIQVTAQNGDTRTYTVRLIRQGAEPPYSPPATFTPNAVTATQPVVSDLTGTSAAFSALIGGQNFPYYFGVGFVDLGTPPMQMMDIQFVYGTGSNFVAATPSTVGRDFEPVAATVTNLTPNTTYTVSVRWTQRPADDNGGNITKSGPTFTFTTPSNSNANLSALTTNAGDITPGFSPDVSDYNILLNSGVTSVTVGWTKADANSVLSDGSGPLAGTSKAYSIPAEGTTVTLVNTAQNGTTTRTYNLNFAYSTAPPTASQLDASFTGPVLTGSSGVVRGIGSLPDGRFIVTGDFTFPTTGGNKSRLARINPDGSVDPNFPAPPPDSSVPAYLFGPNNNVLGVQVRADGKMWIWGNFTSYNGTPTPARYALLNGDGSLDFTPAGPAVSTQINGFDSTPDGKVVLHGLGLGERRLADGSIDPSFTAFQLNTATFAGSGGHGVFIQPDGKIAYAGSGYDQQAYMRGGRFNADGSRDFGFSPGPFGRANYGVLALEGSGSVFYFGDDTYRAYKVNADGAKDASYATPGGSRQSVYSLVARLDGVVYVGGNFTDLGRTGGGNHSTHRLGRTFANGQPDTTGFQVTPAPSANVEGIFLLPDGKLLAGGGFTTFAGVNVNRVIRLQGDEATQAITIPDANTVRFEASPTSPEFFEVVIEHSTDLTNWTQGAATRLPGGVWEATGLSLPANGYVRVRAELRGGYYSSSVGQYAKLATLGSTVLTPVATTLPPEGPRFKASVNPSGLPVSVAFEYGPTTAYGSEISAGNIGGGFEALALGGFAAELLPGQVYNYRVRVTYGDGSVVYGGNQTITPPNNVAALAGLAISTGVLTPEFDPATLAYTVVIPGGVQSNTITPAALDPNAVVTVNNVIVASGEESLPIAVGASSAGQTNTISVTSENGLVQQTYTILVRREPTVTTASASNIKRDGATLRGVLVANGASTTIRFDYGEDETFTTFQSVNGSPASATGGSIREQNIPLTGLLPNTAYFFRLASFNATLDQTFFGAVQSFTTLSESEVWRIDAFGNKANAGEGADGAAPAGDGVANLLKFATGADPRTAVTMPGDIDFDGTNLTFTYTRNKAAATEVTFLVEWSDDLAAWQTAGISETATDQGETELVTVTVPRGAGPQRFIHLKVIRE